MAPHTAAPVDPTSPRRGRPPLTPAARAERRADLTRSAMEAVRAGGPDQSLDDLASRVGVSKPVLYDTFGDRTGLAEAMSVELADRMERTVIGQLGAPRPDGTYDVTVDRITEMVVQGLVSLVEREPDLYAFIVSAIRGERRGLLDNALVQVVHERIRPVIELATPSLSTDEHTVLTNGIYGLVLGTLESWQGSRSPSGETTLPRETVVRMLTTMILEGLHAVGATGDG